MTTDEVQDDWWMDVWESQRYVVGGETKRIHGITHGSSGCGDGEHLVTKLSQTSIWSKG